MQSNVQMAGIYRLMVKNYKHFPKTLNYWEDLRKELLDVTIWPFE